MKIILKSICFWATTLVTCSSVFAQNNERIVVDFEPGDARRKYEHPNRIYSTSQEAEFVEEFEKTRERHDLFIYALGPDSDWAADVEKAKAEGGYVIEAVITPGENAELCMLPTDAEKVTHLKLTGRAFKWLAYGPDSEELKLREFLLRMPNLKVLNLRDLDCEIYWVNGPKTLEKIVMPANCTSAMFDYIPPKIVYPSNRLLAIGRESIENGKRVLSMGEMMMGGGFNTSRLREVEFPEGLLYIAELWIRDDCQKLVFPSTLKRIESFGRYMGFASVLKNLKEVHLKSATPPELGQFNYKYEHLKGATLYVPRGTKDVYMKHLNWRQFGNIVEEDVVSPTQKVVKPMTNPNLVQGKWRFVKEELYDPANIFKDRKPIQTQWINLENGILEECWLEKGKEVRHKTNYKVEGYNYYLDVEKGTARFDIEKLDLEEFVISITIKNPNMDYKITYYHERVKE